jgi:hypothetical protein
MRLTLPAAFLALALAACGQQQDSQSDPLATDNLLRSPIGAAEVRSGPVIEVPSDPNARYADEGSGTLPNGNIWITTSRDGPSDLSFAKREIDCDSGTFRYLQEGDTIGNMTDVPGAEMAPLTHGSISTFVSDYACRKHGRRGVSGI